ncbi:AraC family transcriptional regulator [Blautia sp. RD014234]|nr:AraC family transcriptional regulator [Blautia parvula]
MLCHFPELNRKVTDQNMRELLRFSIFKRIQEHLRENRSGFVIKREPNSSNVILLMEKDRDDAWVREEIRRIREHIYGEYKIWLITGVGKRVEQASDLKYAYKTAKFSCELYYFCEEDVVWYQEISREFCSSFEDYNTCYKELLDQILNRREEWTAALTRILDIIENLHYGNRYAAENRCIAMAMDLFRDLQEYRVLTEDFREEYDRFTAKIRAQSTFRELKKLVCTYLGKLIGENAFNGTDSERETITLVKNYIQEHYAEDIGLGSMAKMVYMNPYYFSTFFKKETGQNFKNYLVEVRMREAMKLLMASDMKTYELAEAVGYHDVRTFTDKFREVFGDSPSAYKKRRKI